MHQEEVERRARIERKSLNDRATYAKELALGGVCEREERACQEAALKSCYGRNRIRDNKSLLAANGSTQNRRRIRSTSRLCDPEPSNIG